MVVVHEDSLDEDRRPVVAVAEQMHLDTCHNFVIAVLAGSFDS